MSNQKKNVISEARKRLLTQKDVVYTVRCNGTHCDCSQFGIDCRRGFFSLWLQAVYGIYFAKKLDTTSYIDFGDKPYMYSDPAQYQGELNFWNYYYEQGNKPEGRIIPNEQFENYPLRIWKRNHLRKVHQSVVKNLMLNNQVKSYIENLLSLFKEFRTLGVHIRGTDHPDEVPKVPFDRYRTILKAHLKSYQKIFVATDEQALLESLQDEFGDRLVFQSAIRAEGNQAIHTDLSIQDRYRLGLEVLADCYALAGCDKAILVHSNVSYASLLLNPELKYNLLETKESLSKRLKTELLYTLDHWGIRRM